MKSLCAPRLELLGQHVPAWDCACPSTCSVHARSLASMPPARMPTLIATMPPAVSKAVSATGAGMQQAMEEVRGSYPGAPMDVPSKDRQRAGEGKGR